MLWAIEIDVVFLNYPYETLGAWLCLRVSLKQGETIGALPCFLVVVVKDNVEITLGCGCSTPFCSVSVWSCTQFTPPSPVSGFASSFSDWIREYPWRTFSRWIGLDLHLFGSIAWAQNYIGFAVNELESEISKGWAAHFTVLFISFHLENCVVQKILFVATKCNRSLLGWIATLSARSHEGLIWWVTVIPRYAAKRSESSPRCPRLAS
jgi:hypothetical protein